MHLQRERLEALRTAGNEPLAVGQLGYSEGPAARPIRELASLNGIWILHPQTISDNYVVRRGGGGEYVCLCAARRVWGVF